jgi:plastocyanin
MQKLIFLLVFSLSTFYFLLFTGGLLLAHEASPHGELIIRMTENGFEPRELTVTAGDEVLFINNDASDRWPASNFHPAHTLYPEFDPLQSVPPGSSWKMTFNREGTWRMHDHLNPHMTGTIVVLENPATTPAPEFGETEEETDVGFFEKLKKFSRRLWQKIFSNDAAASSKLLEEFKKLDEGAKYIWLEDLAREESPETAWQYVKDAYRTPKGVIGNPHDLSHLVGQLIFETYGFQGLHICEPVFAFGCYHGLMAVAFNHNEEKDYLSNLSAAEAGCGTLGDQASADYWSCIHGMGHGIATFREYDLKKSLEDCDFLDEQLRTYCHDGVFMEFSISAPPSFYKKENPIYPCDAVDESYQTACARSQVQVMRLRLGLDTDNIVRNCQKTGNDSIIFHCIDALGYSIGQTSGGRASKIILDCRQIEGEKLEAQCASAAAGELVFQDYQGWPQAVTEVCESLGEPFQNSCRERVRQVKRSYSRN